MKKNILPFLIFSILYWTYGNANALNENCGEKNKNVHGSCKFVKFKELPEGVKRLMKVIKCDVTTESSYDDGYALDLNNDGKNEYAFCCQEASHGPCSMRIFSNINGAYKDILPETMSGFGDGKTPCFGFVVLNTTTNGFHDICTENVLLKFLEGGYTSSFSVDIK